MNWDAIVAISQLVAAVGVVLSLIFVGLQIKQNTRALQRTEHNSTMEQWTVIRQAIAQNRDVAELVTAGLQGERTLDAADQLRLEQMLQENAWAAFHIWDRTQRGIFPKGTFEATGGALLSTLLRTPGGRELVAQRQKDWIPSRVRLRRRRRARQGLIGRWPLCGPASLPLFPSVNLLSSRGTAAASSHGLPLGSGVG